jgi:hypothetical protein
VVEGDGKVAGCEGKRKGERRGTRGRGKERGRGPGEEVVEGGPHRRQGLEHDVVARGVGEQRPHDKSVQLPSASKSQGDTKS